MRSGPSHLPLYPSSGRLPGSSASSSSSNSSPAGSNSSNRSIKGSSSRSSSNSRAISSSEDEDFAHGVSLSSSSSWRDLWSFGGFMGFPVRRWGKGAPRGPAGGPFSSFFPIGRRRLRRRLRLIKARARVLLQLPVLVLLHACPVVGRLLEWVFHLSSLGAPAFLYPFGCLLAGIFSPFASLTALCLWFVELLDVALVAPQAAAGEIASLAAAPPAIFILNHFYFSPVWSASPTCRGMSTHTSSIPSSVLSASPLGGPPWRALDIWGLCLPLGGGPGPWGALDSRGPLWATGARGTMQLSIYCRVLVDVPLLTLALHLSRWLHAQSETFGAPLNVDDDVTPLGGGGGGPPGSRNHPVRGPNPPPIAGPSSAQGTEEAADTGSPASISSNNSNNSNRDSTWSSSPPSISTPEGFSPACEGPLRPYGPPPATRGPSRWRLWGRSMGPLFAVATSPCTWKAWGTSACKQLLRFLRRCLASSPAWASLSGVKKLYLAAITYMGVRWMYTDRIDLLVGAPAAAVVGPLIRGPPEAQAAFMCASVICAVALLASFGLLSLLKAADLLPARLLHYTRVLCCTHLVAYGKKNKKRGPSGAPETIDTAGGTNTPSSASSREQEACIFCFEELKPGELLRIVTACGHKFHAACIDVWLFERLKASCPMCGRLRYPTGDGPLWGQS